MSSSKAIERGSQAHIKGEPFATFMRDAYYQAVFEHHIQETSRILRRSVRVLEAAALLHFDIESFMRFILAQRIGLFQWRHQERHRTWAVLSSIDAMNINLPNAANLAESRRWLSDVIGFTKLDPEHPFDRAVDMFCVLLQRAHEHRLNGRGDESALHFVIALDALLGTETRSAESVAVRAAVITHIPFARSLHDQIKTIKGLYDARSKYVHEGREMSAEAVRESERVATEVLWALLVVSGARKLSNTAQWLTKIDYIAAAVKDGRDIPDEELIALGIARGADLPRVPPTRVIETMPEVMFDIGRRVLPKPRRT